MTTHPNEDPPDTADHEPADDPLAHMRNVAARYRRVAGTFTLVAQAVPTNAWDNAAPCEGWVARDVIRHMVEWVPGFFAGSGLVFENEPSVDVDPLQAWVAFSNSVEAVLDDPVAARKEFAHPQAGTHLVADAIDRFFTGDVLIHTWDLARATGGDEHLDTDEVAQMLAGLEPLDEMLRASGQYGPRVDAPTGADVQTRLIAFTGRRP